MQLHSWPDEAATQRYANKLAAHPRLRQALLELHGELGAGKTTFVRHMLRALGITGRIKSPSYALVETYSARTPDTPHTSFNVWHFDFYRFEDPSEWEQAGFRDIFASPGLKLVEWPQKAQQAMPQADLALHIRIDNDPARQVQVMAYTELGRELIQ